MKRLFLFGLVAFAACNTADKANLASADRDSLNAVAMKDSSSYTSILWLDSTHTDIGRITEGQVVEVSWRFRNVGDKPLLITDVKAGCGCTVPEKPIEPIPPGGESLIPAVFHSKGQGRRFNKTITVTANTKNGTKHYLSFSGEAN